MRKSAAPFGKEFWKNLRFNLILFTRGCENIFFAADFFEAAPVVFYFQPLPRHISHLSSPTGQGPARSGRVCVCGCARIMIIEKIGKTKKNIRLLKKNITTPPTPPPPGPGPGPARGPPAYIYKPAPPGARTGTDPGTNRDPPDLNRDPPT